MTPGPIDWHPKHITAAATQKNLARNPLILLNGGFLASNGNKNFENPWKYLLWFILGFPVER
jgi:hypothetical protein